jgi:hypothetical protein
LDAEPYRYQKFLSDIAGHDIKAHSADAGKAIKVVRDWLRTASRTPDLPGSAYILGQYERFLAELPALCEELHWECDALDYPDFLSLTTEWIRNNRSR